MEILPSVQELLVRGGDISQDVSWRRNDNTTLEDSYNPIQKTNANQPQVHLRLENTLL